MKFTLVTTQSSYNLLRRAGYAPFSDPKTNGTSYTRRLGSNFYPRFHIYINKEEGSGLELNLHLDQKHASYAGQNAHSGEYNGDILRQEADRIRTLAVKEPVVEPPKKGFLQRLFGK